MDYNRVQSYIKAHVLPKLDSLPQDVQSVKNAFDAWKADWTQARAVKLDNLDATISSRASSQAVDGVRGGVDTTLQRLTDLEGSVARLQDGLAEVNGGLLEVRKNNEPIKGALVYKGTTSIKIEGAGCVVAYFSRNKSKVNIDGKTTEVGLNNSVCSWVCMPYSSYDANNTRYLVKCTSSDNTELNVFKPRYVYNSFENIAAESFSLQPIRFDRLLEISSESYFDIIYSLDPT